MDLLSTTLQEIHSDGRSYEFTGRLVTIPNAVFLSQAVRNETFYGKYVYHKFSLIFDAGKDFAAVVVQREEPAFPIRVRDLV